MKVFINGTNNANKGAELMFCAICQQLEKRYPESEIIMPSYMVSPWSSNKLKFNYRKHYKIIDFLSKYKVAGILRKLHLPYVFLLRNGIASKDLDIMFSAHGYGFGDIWQKSSETGRIQNDYLRLLHKHGTKIIFLPQAFGPFSNPGSIATGKAILKYSDLVCAREKTSFDHLLSLQEDMSNVCIYPDFTAVVEGTDGISILEDAIVLIPNMRMISEAGVTLNNYCTLYEKMLTYAHKLNKDIVLFNHESSGDLELCRQINEKFGGKYRIISGLSALDTKGALSKAYAVVSSRFHGVANCLSTNVPVVSSSWNSKYEMLFRDYGFDDMVLDMKDSQCYDPILSKVLDVESNIRIRKHLIEQNEKHKAEINKMWDDIFNQYVK